MDTVLAAHRFHFAFTVVYHYLFPQLTMGLALLIVLMKTLALRAVGERALHLNRAVRFWARIFGINFVMGVVTGIPMEFQFGTNWSRFAQGAGGIIGQTLAMEGVFAFFLESSFLGLLLHGEEKLGPRGHWMAALLVWLGSWVSGFFIVATNAWMQHPVGYRWNGSAFELSSLWALLTNPWATWQYLHTMLGAVVTGAFAMGAVGAYYVLSDRHAAFGRTFLQFAVPVGLAASLLAAFPTGDSQGKLIARYQPTTLAAMEALFDTQHGAPLAIVGQPDMENERLDNPVTVPRALSFLTYYRWKAQVRGLNEFPREDWPQHIPLLYYAFHIMVGLGTLFILIMILCGIALLRGGLFQSRPLLWALLIAFPFPYVANTAGWMTAELGRQPWLIHGLMRTAEGASVGISTGNALFTLLGFMGMYTLLSMLFLFLVTREIDRGPTNPGGGEVGGASGAGLVGA